jgi:hypothetical protein
LKKRVKKSPPEKEETIISDRIAKIDQPTMNGTTASNTPAATALPITPATFGPMACMSKKFCGSDS